MIIKRWYAKKKKCKKNEHTYYAFYKYDKERGEVMCKVQFGEANFYFGEATFQETIEEVDDYLRAVLLDMINNPAILWPKPTPFEELRFKYKPADGFKCTAMTVYRRTGEIVHVKLDDKMEAGIKFITPKGHDYEARQAEIDAIVNAAKNQGDHI